MKNGLIGLLIGLVSLTGIVQSEAVFKIVGSQAACDTTFAGCSPIPLTVTTLCTVSCTRLSSPSLTDSSRMWGTDTSNCRTSVYGGVTWANCASNPDVAVLYHYASAADGSVLAAGITNGGTHCKIYKSTNNATSWVNVFDDAVVSNCGDGGASGGTRLKCGANGTCALVFANTGTAQTVVSTNNGDSWVRTALTAISYTPISLVFNGTSGFSTPTLSDGISNFKAFRYSGGWSLGATWPAVTRCWPSIALSGGSSLCQTGGTGTSYTLRSGAAGALVNTISIPNGITSANPGMIAINPFGNALYVVTNDDAGKMGVWVGLDGTTASTLVRVFTGPAALAMTNQSDINYANGCIYFSAGNVTPIFAKIC